MKKKILIVSPYNNGTIGLCSMNLFKAFRQRTDCEVKFIVVHKFQDGYKEIDECDYCITAEAPIYLKWMNLIKQLRWLKMIKKHFKPDLTISTSYTCSTINILARGNDVKIGIFHAPHFQEREKGIIVYLNTLLNYSFVYPRLDGIACVSSEVKNSITSNFAQYKNKDVRVIYNIHDIGGIYSKSRECIPHEESNIVTSNSVVYVGRLDRNKAPIRSLKAFHLGLQQLPHNANLIFIGKDYDNVLSELEEYVHKHSLEERVFFLGFRDNPYKYLSKVKCLISSSYSEGLPGVIIESLLLGKRVVTTNSSSGIWEIMSCYDSYDESLSGLYECNNGIITSNLSKPNDDNPSDIDNLSNAIVRIIASNSIVDFTFKDNIQSSAVTEQFLSYYYASQHHN